MQIYTIDLLLAFSAPPWYAEIDDTNKQTLSF